MALAFACVNALHAQSLEVTLASPAYNGYHITCFGAQDGAIDATITGGTAPYIIQWSNGSNAEDQAGLAAGLYIISVKDANFVEVQAQITLLEPVGLRIGATPFQYLNGYNISCYECYNGSIDVTVDGGVPPYSYDWGDEVYTPDRTGLGALPYAVSVTDANQCRIGSERITLTQPERNDWQMGGNANTDPSTQYIGTSDAQDVVFRSNGVERLRLLADGDVKLPGLSASAPAMLYIDSLGNLKRFVDGDIPTIPQGCPDHGALPWTRCGNYISNLEFLGSINEQPLVLKTHNQERLRITSAGRVAIGSSNPTNRFEVHHADERGGMSLVNNAAGNAHSEIRFSAAGTQRWGLGCDLDADGGQDFFLWDDVSDAVRLRIDDIGRVGIGNAAFGTSSLYKLYVEGGIVTRDVLVTAEEFPDFVFANDYVLRSLNELRAYLKAHSHMPGIPSAAEVETKGGVEVGDLQVRMLQVVEEQALYILQLEERLARIEQRVTELETIK